MKRTRSPPFASLLTTSSQILDSCLVDENFALDVAIEDVFVGANGVTDVVVDDDEAEGSDFSSRTCCM